MHMLSIHLDDLAEYDFKTIYQFILPQKERSFEILIPKENTIEKDDQFFVFLDYYLAAYAGEKLSEAGSFFSYYVPSVSEITSFRFQLEVTDLERFTDVLYLLVKGYYDPDDMEQGENFYEQAARFHEDAWLNFDAACWGLVQVAAEYIS